MRSILFAVLAAMLAAANPTLADGPAVGQGGKGLAAGRPGAPAQLGQAAQPAGAGVAQPGVAQPGRPGVGIGVQPGGAPGFPFGQPPDAQRMREMAITNMARSFGLRIPPATVKWGGMVLEPADAALLDQLDLPAGKGMVVAAVDADSAAAKAGLKKHDLIVKINAQAVPGDARDLIKSLADSKADTPVDLALLRKGKEQTLKAVKLPAATLAGGPKLPGGAGGGPPVGPGFPPPPGVGVPPQPPAGAPPIVGRPPFVPGGGIAAGVRVDALEGRVSINRNNDQFNCDYQKDKLHVTVRGKVANNQVTAEQITVDDGKETKKYEKVQDVPQGERTIVNRLLQMVSGGNFPRFPVPPARPGAGAVPPAPGVPARPQR